MAKRLNTKLYRTIGITFSFKEFLQEYLSDLQGNALLIEEFSSEQKAEFDRLVEKFVLCGPSMGFSAKQYLYEALEIVVQVLINAPTLTDENEAERLNKGLLKIVRYVGLEGEEDFNFAQAVYFLAETISSITGETVQILSNVLGAVVTLNVFDGGNGYTASQATYELEFESSDNDGSTPGEVEVSSDADGVIALGTYTVDDGGDGFAVGQIVLLVDSSLDPGTYSPALAEVVSIA
jgi:hypothetical protein